jgi:hypothetical protein
VVGVLLWGGLGVFCGLYDQTEIFSLEDVES